MLLVCSIFRRICGSSSSFTVADDLFWELLNVCQKIGTTSDGIPMLCFDSNRYFTETKQRVLSGSAAKPAHLSRTDTTCADLMCCKDLLGELTKFRVLIDVAQTGRGKTTNWLIALIFRVIMLLVNDAKEAKEAKDAKKTKGVKSEESSSKGGASVFCAGPLNNSSRPLVNAICHAIEETLRKQELDIRIIPVENAIVPRGPAKDENGRIVVYVFMSNSLDDLPAVLGRFDDKHRMVVMIDDNPVDDLNRVLKSLINSESIMNVVACGASINTSSLDSKLGAIIRGNNTTTLSSISAVEQICEDVPMTIPQMKQVRELVLSGTEFFISNQSSLTSLCNLVANFNYVLKSLSKVKSDARRRCWRRKFDRKHRVYVFLLEIFPLEVARSIQRNGESDEAFERRFLHHFTKLYIDLLLKTCFKRPVIEHEYEMFLKCGEDCNVFEMAEKFAPIFKEYLDTVLNNLGLRFLFTNPLPELPSGILTVSQLLDLNMLYQNALHVLTCAGFVLNDPLNFPKRVSKITKLVVDGIIDESKNLCCFVMLGPELDPMKIANELSEAKLVKHGKVLTEEEKKIQERRDHDKRNRGKNDSVRTPNSRYVKKSHNRTSLSTNSSQSPSKPESSTDIKTELPKSSESEVIDDEPTKPEGGDPSTQIDMLSSAEEQISSLMKSALKVSNQLSSTASAPTLHEVQKFVSWLPSMKSPIAIMLVKLFASGVFLPMSEMPYEMIMLAISIFEQGRLIFIIQEGKDAWDMRSQNFRFKYPVIVFFLSEVSSDFFLQNCIGRFGRMDQKFPAFVMCLTPSGRIVNESFDSAEPALKAQCSLQKLNISHLDEKLLVRIETFISQCSSLSESHVVFLKEFLKLFSSALYDHEFKYATCSRLPDRFFFFLSCHLTAMFCGLEVSGTINGKLDGFLQSLAINENARKQFQFLSTQSPDCLDVISGFVRHVSMLLDDSRVNVAASLCCAIENRVFPGFNHSLLVSMFFKIKELLSFTDRFRAFLTNLYFSSFKSSNEEVRPMITLLGCLRATMEDLNSLIASSVQEGEFLKELLTKRRLGCLKAPEQVSPLECSKKTLLASPQTITDFMAELQRDGACGHILLEFNRRSSSFGPKSSMLRFRVSLDARLRELASSNQELSDDLSKLAANDSDLDSKVCVAQTKVDTAMKDGKPSKISSTIAMLTKAKEDAGAAKAVNEASRNKFKEQMESNQRAHQDTLSQIAECEFSLSKYGQMSEAEFLQCFLSEVFD